MIFGLYINYTTLYAPYINRIISTCPIYAPSFHPPALGNFLCQMCVLVLGNFLMNIFSINLYKLSFNHCQLYANTTTYNRDFHSKQHVQWSFLPSSWGNSSHKMAMEVLSPWSRDKVKEAPIAKPSMKLCTASLSVTIQAMVPIFDSGRPLRHLHKLLWVAPS